MNELAVSLHCDAITEVLQNRFIRISAMAMQFAKCLAFNEANTQQFPQEEEKQEEEWEPEPGHRVTERTNGETGTLYRSGESSYKWTIIYDNQNQAHVDNDYVLKSLFRQVIDEDLQRK